MSELGCAAERTLGSFMQPFWFVFVFFFSGKGEGYDFWFIFFFSSISKPLALVLSVHSLSL